MKTTTDLTGRPGSRANRLLALALGAFALLAYCGIYAYYLFQP